MRSIKFRVWHKAYQKMDDCMKWSGPFDDGWPFADPAYEFMQFTGVLDKNGMEIYDGDIVKSYEKSLNYKSAPSCQEKIYRVYWGKYSDGEYANGVECWMAGDSLPLSESGTGGTYGHPDFVVEIIGNIFETPWLLNKA